MMGFGFGLGRRLGIGVGLGGGVTYEWLMRDEFVATLAAGEINGTTAEPSSGYTRTVVDTTNKATIAGEQFRLSGGNSTFGDPFIQWTPGIARANGLCLIYGAGNQGTQRYGFTAASGYSSEEMIWYPASNTIVDKASLGTVAIDAPASPSAYAIVVRTKGAHFFYRDAQGRWVRMYVGDVSNAATIYPILTTFTNSTNLEYVRLAQLSGPWQTNDWAVAHEYYATADANTVATLTDSGEGWVECAWAATTGGTRDIIVRRSDADNYWIVRATQAATSTIKIIEYNAGAETERASTNVTINNSTTYRILIHLNGQVITPYISPRNSVPRTKCTSYTSTFNQTATGVRVSAAVTELAIWRKYETQLPSALVDAIGTPTGMEYTAELSAFKAAAAAGGTMKVVYVGTSITNGSSATNAATESFRAVVGAWLDSNYPNTSFTHVNAGVGGTRSWYALVRLATDVVAHNPALVLVDMCNDNAATADRAAGEALLRLIRSQLPNAAIIGNLFQGYSGYLSNNTTPNAEDSRRWQRRIMNYYRVPFHDWTLTLAAEVAAGNDMADYLADMTHPNTAGHALIATKVIELLQTGTNGSAVNWATDLASFTRLDPMTDEYENDPIITLGADGSRAGTWTVDGTSIQTTDNVTPATVEFSGTFQSFGLDSNYGGGAGIAAYSVDGGTYTNYNLADNATTNLMVTSFATRAARTITIKAVSGTVRINRFLAI